MVMHSADRPLATPVARVRATRRSHPFTWSIPYAALGASSCVVLIEPAPFDVLALLLIAHYAIRSRMHPVHHRADALTVQIVSLLLLFALLQVVPIAMSADDAAKSAFYAAITTYLVIIGIHLADLHHRQDRRFASFLAGYLAAAILSALLAISSLHPSVAALAPDLLFSYGRPKALFKDPNVLGPYLVPAVLIFFILAASARRVPKLLYLLASLTCTLGVVVTASRAAWVNLAVVIVLFLAVTPLKYKLLGLWTVIVLGSSTLIYSDELLSQRYVASSVELYRQRMELQRYDKHRFLAAKDAINTGLNNPVGVGPGRIRSLFYPDPHNTYVRILAENGVAAFALFASLLLMVGIRAARELLQRKRGTVAFTAGLCLLAGVLVNASVVDALHWRHFWLIIAFCAFVSRGRLAARRPTSAAVPRALPAPPGRQNAYILARDHAGAAPHY